MFLEINFCEEQKITASTSTQVGKVIGMYIREMVLKLVSMKSLEFTLPTSQLVKIRVRRKHCCRTNTVLVLRTCTQTAKYQLTSKKCTPQSLQGP